MNAIDIAIREKIATKICDTVYICGNSDFIVRFDFDEEWNDYEAKTVRFVTQNNEHVDVPFVGNECAVPVFSDVHNFRVGVFAGNLHTTTSAYVPAKKSILCGTGDKPIVPKEDAYDKMMEDINADAVRAETAANASTAASNAALKAKGQAESHANIATASAAAAQAAETASAKEAQRAETAAGTAVQSAANAKNAADAAAGSANAGAGYASSAAESAKGAGTSAQSAAGSASVAQAAAERATAAADSMPDIEIIRVSYADKVYTSSHTFDEITQLVAAGKTLFAVDHTSTVYSYVTSDTVSPYDQTLAKHFAALYTNQIQGNTEMAGIWEKRLMIRADGTVKLGTYSPATTPNPFALNITKGEETFSYDGKKEVSLNISENNDLFIVRYRAGSADKTYKQIMAAAEEKLAMLLVETISGEVYPYAGRTTEGCRFAKIFASSSLTEAKENSFTVSSSDQWSYITKIVNARNPYPIRLTGAVTATYDGSEQVTVEIPAGGDGTGLPTGGDPHQMLVTDAEGKAKWEERIIRPPEVGIVEVLPELTVTVDPDMGAVLFADPIALVAGETYTVQWNGVTYNTAAQVVGDDGVDLGVAIGNVDLVNGVGDSGEPFVVMKLYEEFAEEMSGMRTQIVPLDGSTDITLKIEGEGTVYHRLGLDYLPEDMYGMVDGEITCLRETSVYYYSNTPFIQTLFSNDLVVGDTYTVIWDGVRYDCVATELTINDEHCAVLSGEGFPRIVQFKTPRTTDDSYTFYGAILTEETIRNVVFSIVRDGSVPKKIPEKYLPERKAMYVDYAALSDSTGAIPAPYTNVNLTKQHSYDEAFAMLKNGNWIAIVINGVDFARLQPLMVGASENYITVTVAWEGALKNFTFDFT